MAKLKPPLPKPPELPAEDNDMAKYLTYATLMAALAFPATVFAQSMSQSEAEAYLLNSNSYKSCTQDSECRIATNACGIDDAVNEQSLETYSLAAKIHGRVISCVSAPDASTKKAVCQNNLCQAVKD